MLVCSAVLPAWSKPFCDLSSKQLHSIDQQGFHGEGRSLWLFLGNVLLEWLARRGEVGDVKLQEWWSGLLSSVVPGKKPQA